MRVLGRDFFKGERERENELIGNERGRGERERDVMIDEGCGWSIDFGGKGKIYLVLLDFKRIKVGKMVFL